MLGSILGILYAVQWLRLSQHFHISQHLKSCSQVSLAHLGLLSVLCAAGPAQVLACAGWRPAAALGQRGEQYAWHSNKGKQA